MMKSTFNRDCSNELIESLLKLKKQNSYVKKLFEDVENGKVFLAFRPHSKVSFYYRGRNICDIDSAKGYEPMINPKYLPILKSDNNHKELINECEWESIICNNNYSWGKIYQEIIDNTTLLSDKEASQTSNLYKFSPMAVDDSKVILLDIETKFRYPVINGVSKRDLRIDAVLYHTEKRQLIFLEVKRFEDWRLQKHETLQNEIVKQLNR